MADARGKSLVNTLAPALAPVGSASPRGRSLRPVMPRSLGSRQEALRTQNRELLAQNRELRKELAELREREAQAQRLADRDGLTGLFNRRRMMELLHTAIDEAGPNVGLLFIDLNGFKAINDEYGHAAGDLILITAAKRIAARVRTGDFVCRYGGDEFVVILPNVPDAAAVSRVADTIRERVALPYWIQGNEQHLTAAIGESMYPHDGVSAEELLNRADQAMYRLKARLARPLMSLGSRAYQQPLRRRNDQSRRP
jgi:diguanylate cyclase (GGDEF)-like protein